MNLKAILEGILFVAGDEGLTLENVINILDTDKEELKKIITELDNDYSKEDRGLKLEYYGERLKIVTKKEEVNEEELETSFYKKLVGEEAKEPLSPSALETLAIIAYNEPITRVMVDEIRGVSSAHIIRKLVFKNFIYEVGRSELPGRPILYGVTPQFLDYFGLKSTKDLPVIEDNEETFEETNLFESKYKEI